ncbi:MAG: aminotransferase class III-fold pyridoxal phosphate-dependent enzyme [Candidatus Aenigmarchaeota archaeon]|nr:aminotransferase class III-fold pyridoxal phosphate-dependent enzyme [Candidatus Aenigmarchaeota archaeon]
MNVKRGIELWKKAKKLIPGGNQLLSKRAEMFLPEQWPSFYTKAKGVEVWDLDNNKFIDMSIMGVGTCVLGYADDDVDNAVKRVIDSGSMSTLNSPEEVELAELLLGLHKWAKMVRYARTGGEAMSIAVRIARAHAGKDNVAFCYDDKTEILTKYGFKKFKDLDENEVVATLNPLTNQLEYHQIEAKIKYHYCGKMLHFKGQRVDLLVTPDHKIYRKFRLKRGHRFGLETASNSVSKKTMIQMTSACAWKGMPQERFSISKILSQTRPTKAVCSFPMKDFLGFMGWYLSEGCCVAKKRGAYEVHIAQDKKNIENSEEIISTIKNLGFLPYRNGHHICFNSKELVQYLKQFGKSRDKYIPDWIKELPPNYLFVFVRAMVKGDGTFEKGRMRKFYSISTKLIDGMQELLLKLGYSTTVSEYKNTGFSRGKIYHLKIGTEKVLGSRASEKDYDGYVYCVTVPNHIILVRRNGKIVWSGNCGYHGWHDWYLSANLADDKALDGHLLSGLEPAGVPRALKGTAIPFKYNDTESLQKIFEKNDDIAAIVMEPVRQQEPVPGFLKHVRKIADDNNAVLIFDEITSGWRMRLGGVYDMYNVRPDIVVYAKAMGNGFPIAAIVGNDVMDAAQKTFISSTCWTERVGPAAAIATINKLRDRNVPDHLIRIGKSITKGWLDSAKEHGLRIKTMGIPPLTAFAFDYENSQAVHTLFTQEMLERSYLASKQVYVSYSHTANCIEKYIESVNDMFAVIKKAIDNNNVEKQLKGPIAHKGFSRLN